MIKPTTYVNNSGAAALHALENNKINNSELLVVHDDVNLPSSQIKVKAKGGDGGHNGIASIIYHLNSDEFARIRIGIGNEFEKGRMAEYVLDDFNIEEMEKLKDSINTSIELIQEFVTGGLNDLLNANSRISNTDKKSDSENNN